MREEREAGEAESGKGEQHAKTTRRMEVFGARNAVGMQRAAKKERRAQEMDREGRRTLQLGHSNQHEAQGGVFDEIAMGADGFLQKRIIAIAERDLGAKAVADDIDREREKQEAKKACVEGGDNHGRPLCFGVRK